MNYEGQGYIAKVMNCVVTDGTGMRVSVYVSGCRFHCPNCFNASIWEFLNGQKVTNRTIEEIIDLIDHDYISGLSLLGGEPLENLAVIRPLIKAFRRKFDHSKDIWMWSGYMIEYIQNTQALAPILKDIDVLVDGPFVNHLYRPDLMFRGSLNQRIHYLNSH
ncbi:anaerobic ribonucleoside-triphosphate reductase activating protein [Macrococcoides caseolyticum]|uniref:anaerobic ribonucleoside-triphosphate reductase activating protein n=1 Tax=Macrococcoides caseolyticum TaxID=69966 RepID=UPI001F446D0E|nr:anaerobic ribonucleoside-triphosphate reductase activating protein [Macrococcus caseolyticus]MCE4957777.1 anaerobic ribonucleoside-triphosphate reductase activating protein [Macrococcus caseolyticus]